MFPLTSVQREYSLLDPRRKGVAGDFLLESIILHLPTSSILFVFLSCTV